MTPPPSLQHATRQHLTPPTLRSTLTTALLTTILTSPTLASASGSRNDRAGREEAKPIYLQDISFGGYTLPFTPVTVIIFLLSIMMALRSLMPGEKSSVTASHILMDGPDAEAKLTKMKGEIGADAARFAAAAGKHSNCPSGKSAGGKLGTFGPGSMVPPFDKAVFDPANAVGVAIGPVQTSHGWHLILIEDRKLVSV